MYGKCKQRIVNDGRTREQQQENWLCYNAVEAVLPASFVRPDLSLFTLRPARHGSSATLLADTDMSYLSAESDIYWLICFGWRSFILFHFKVRLVILELWSVRLEILIFYFECSNALFYWCCWWCQCWLILVYLFWFACVVSVPFDCEFASCKLVGVYGYMNGLAYYSLATAIF